MTIDQAVTRLLTTLRAERAMRDKVLSEPRRSAALLEIDEALIAVVYLQKLLALAYPDEVSQQLTFDQGVK